MAESNIRIDKFLWAVRIYKTRSQATDACKKGKVTIDGVQVKASMHITPDKTIVVRKNQIEYSYKVLNILKNRVSAKLVTDYILDITPKEELDKRDLNIRGGFYYRDKGSGRPTKKERRMIDEINDFMD